MQAEEELRFGDLHTRHPGVTPAIAKCYDEAARVCLDRHHSSPRVFIIRDNGDEQCAIVEWRITSAGARNAWSGARTNVATETGAYALALATVELTRGLVAVTPAETASGCDYFLGRSGDALDDLEVSCRLEISGVDAGGVALLEVRLREKIRQAASGRSILPAMAMVVGFGALTIFGADVEEK